MTVVEVVVQDAVGARIAIDGGADRIELCQALSVGGLTPSLGVAESVIDEIGADRVLVLVRPRAGGFVYDADEVESMIRDVRAIAALGAGVVVGALDDAGGLDTRTIGALAHAAGGSSVTFHRAVDVARSPHDLVASLPALGVTGVLSSGGAVRAVDGIPVLRSMRGLGVSITAGGGVRAGDVLELRLAGVDAVHASCRVSALDAAPSGPGGGSGEVDSTSPALVRDLVAAARD